MSKTIKLALELDLTQPEQASLFAVIGNTLAGKAEAPKAEAPKAEAPKAEAPKAEAPKAEAPKAEAPKDKAPKDKAPKAEAPKDKTGGPVVKMPDILDRVKAVILTPEGKAVQEPIIKAWMADQGYSGRVSGLPKDLWDAFSEFIDTLAR